MISEGFSNLNHSMILFCDLLLFIFQAFSCHLCKCIHIHENPCVWWQSWRQLRYCPPEFFDCTQRPSFPPGLQHFYSLKKYGNQHVSHFTHPVLLGDSDYQEGSCSCKTFVSFFWFFFFLLAHALSKHLLKVFPVLRQESMWSGPILTGCTVGHPAAMPFPRSR